MRRRVLAGAGVTVAVGLMLSAGCALIAGVQDGTLAPDGGGGAGTSSSAASGTTSGMTTSGTMTSGTTTSGTGTSSSSGSPPHFSLVQAVHAGDVTVSTASATANVGTGDLLVVGVFWDATAASIMSVGDSLGNTWHQAIQQTHLKTPCTSSTMEQLWYAENVHGGMDTVNATLTVGGEDLDFFLLDYTGAATVSALDTQGGGVGSAATSTMSAMVTTSQQDLIIALFADTNGDTMTPGAGFESLSQSSYFSAMIADNLAGGAGAGSAPGAYVVSATLGSSDACWAASVLAFRGAN